MLNFRFSVPFLAFIEDQIPYLYKKIGNIGTEAIIFNAADIFNEKWEIAWKNIRKATDHFSPENVTFHFPVNDADYSRDVQVLSKLIEAYQRACDLGLAGIVVHSNCIRKISEWKSLSISDMRCRVRDALECVKKSVSCSGSTWLSIENMPIMDNFGVEIDPLFLYPEDFQIFDNSIGTVLDVCHFFYTVTASNMVFKGLLDASAYPNLRHAKYCDIEKFHNVTHWHFSAFLGIAEHGTKKYCKEGVLPKDGTLPENVYMDAMRFIDEICNNNLVVLELNEEDYSSRSNAKKFIQEYLRRM